MSDAGSPARNCLWTAEGTSGAPPAPRPKHAKSSRPSGGFVESPPVSPIGKLLRRNMLVKRDCRVFIGRENHQNGRNAPASFRELGLRLGRAAALCSSRCTTSRPTSRRRTSWPCSRRFTKAGDGEPLGENTQPSLPVLRVTGKGRVERLHSANRLAGGPSAPWSFHSLPAFPGRQQAAAIVPPHCDHTILEPPNLELDTLPQVI